MLSGKSPDFLLRVCGSYENKIVLIVGTEHLQAMMKIKNIAGNAVSIFLFRFVIYGDGISFVLNESIAEDMYEDIDEKMKPLVHACCETLLRYRHLSGGNTIMDGNILEDGVFEVMLSKGLGRHFAEHEKQQLFQDAKKIADLLIRVMKRGPHELKRGKQVDQPLKEQSQSQKKIKERLEELGEKKHLLAELQWLVEGKKISSGLKPLRPEDLPSGVVTSRGYDHRGHCLVLDHHTLGEIGKIVLIKDDDGQMLMQAELCTGQRNLQDALVKQKSEIFEAVVSTVNNWFDEIRKSSA